MTDSNSLRPLKRFITTHNDKGEAVFSSAISEDNERVNYHNDTVAFALGYTTNGFPVDLNNDSDIEGYKPYLKEAPGLTVSNGTVLRFVDFAPGLDSPMHRTVSLDYGVVIEGEVELKLDSGETRLMKKGDVAIQRGTSHAWKNASETKWLRMMFVLQPCKPIEIAGQALGEDLGDIKGVRSSD